MDKAPHEIKIRPIKLALRDGSIYVDLKDDLQPVAVPARVRTFKMRRKAEFWLKLASALFTVYKSRHNKAKLVAALAQTLWLYLRTKSE
jgi:hypothetical protein